MSNVWDNPANNIVLGSRYSARDVMFVIKQKREVRIPKEKPPAEVAAPKPAAGDAKVCRNCQTFQVFAKAPKRGNCLFHNRFVNTDDTCSDFKRRVDEVQ